MILPLQLHLEAKTYKHNPEKALKMIMRGDIDKCYKPKNRKRKIVEFGNRIPNIVLRKTVEKLRARDLSETSITNKILFFDELAETKKVNC